MDNWIMDYETLTNCFVGVFQHYKNETRKVFIVHKLQNDFGELVKVLQENEELRQRLKEYKQQLDAILNTPHTLQKSPFLDDMNMTIFD